jgi:hypothetical protein
VGDGALATPVVLAVPGAKLQSPKVIHRTYLEPDSVLSQVPRSSQPPSGLIESFISVGRRFRAGANPGRSQLYHRTDARIHLLKHSRTQRIRRYGASQTAGRFLNYFVGISIRQAPNSDGQHTQLSALSMFVVPRCQLGNHVVSLLHSNGHRIGPICQATMS